jgi:adenylate cyclase
VSLAASTAPSAEELLSLRELGLAVDETLEHSLIAREGLDATFRRLLPRLLEWTGARAVAVQTRDEHLEEGTWSEGEGGGRLARALRACGVQRDGSATSVSQVLDVVGTSVGSMALLFDGDWTSPERSARAQRMLQTIAEALDTVLETVHTAAEKQELILGFSTQLAHRVFEAGMDQAVLALAEKIPIPGFLLIFRDAIDSGLLHYRAYRDGHLEHDSVERRFPKLDAAIDAVGAGLIARGDQSLRRVVEPHRTIEAVLISSAPGEAPLGKILVWNESSGFSAFALDVIRLLAATLTQRLVDYNRERIHLSHFFSARVIDELVRDPHYEQTFLSARDEEIGILFADINAFTKICERVLESPSRIGRFVDRWSAGAVDILWKHGGVFDKMVGDCVIGLFGPPFFRTGRVARAEAAVRAGFEIQSFTAAMSSDPELAALAHVAEPPGLGVAIGINLAHAFCGMFGPNHAYTGFSSGMNQTARLQSLGKFREILLMESARQALEKSEDPFCRGLEYGPLEETPVKNVANPLRYYRLVSAALRP